MKRGPKGDVNMEPLPWTPRSTGADQLRLFAEKYLAVPHGKGAGRGLRLRPWQVEMCRTLYAPGVDLACWVIPRGNGKSGLAAAIALHHVFMWGYGARCAIVAQDERSALRLLKTAATMVELNDDLAERAHVYRDRIVVPGMGAELVALPAEAHRVEGERLTLAVLDEVGYMPADTFEAAVLSTGKQDGSKTLCIGTPSPFAWRDKSPLWTLVKRGRAEGDTGSMRLVEYGADMDDDPDDPATWAAANPAYGDWLSEKAIRSQRATVRDHEFRRARLGVWLDGSIDAAIPPKEWKECARPGVQIPRGSRVVLALDGSKSGDATAVLIGSVSARPHFQVGGLWTPTEGEDVPVLEVEDRIRQLAAQYRVVEVAYDPFRWQRTAQVLEEDGINMVQFPQTLRRLTPATTDLRAGVVNHLLTHDDDPDLTAHVLRAQLEETRHGVKLAKPSKGERIDLAACLIMGYSRAAWLGGRARKKKVRGIK